MGALDQFRFAPDVEDLATQIEGLLASPGVVERLPSLESVIMASMEQDLPTPDAVQVSAAFLALRINDHRRILPEVIGAQLIRTIKRPEDDPSPGSATMQLAMVFPESPAGPWQDVFQSGTDVDWDALVNDIAAQQEEIGALPDREKVGRLVEALSERIELSEQALAVDRAMLATLSNLGANIGIVLVHEMCEHTPRHHRLMWRDMAYVYQNNSWVQAGASAQGEMTGLLALSVKGRGVPA